MIKYLTCFKCWGGVAVLTYEENRIYKVSCECGCNYTFEHCSLSAAQEYHNKMLELYGEIDKNVKLKAENERLKVELDALKARAIRAESDYEKARNHATNLTRRVKAFEQAARAFESATGIFSFACFCCAYKDRDDIHKCELLGDDVCEDLENWEFDEARFTESGTCMSGADMGREGAG